MVKWKKYLSLFRWPNLCILIIIGLLIRYAVFYPIIYYAFPEAGANIALSNIQFILLTLSIVLIAASGNLYNDIYDIQADEINKPEKVKFYHLLSKETALNLHHVLNAIAMILAFILSYQLDNFKLCILFILPIILLRFYSTNFKHLPFIGNLIIGILAALVPVTYGILEATAIHLQFNNIYLFVYNLNFWESPNGYALNWCFGLAAFSFLLTIAREIIKDIEDIEGDKKANSKTLPIVLGIKKTKWICAGFILGTIYLIIHLGMGFIFDDSNRFPYGYIYSTLLIAALVALLIQTFKAKKTVDYKVASTLSKGIMLLGIFYTIIHVLFYQSTF